MNPIFLDFYIILIQEKKIATLVTKAELKAKEDKIVKLQAFHSSYFRDKSYFQNDGNQNYLDSLKALVIPILQHGNQY